MMLRLLSGSIVEVSAIAEGIDASWRYWRLSQIVLGASPDW